MIPTNEAVLISKKRPFAKAKKIFYYYRSIFIRLSTVDWNDGGIDEACLFGKQESDQVPDLFRFHNIHCTNCQNEMKEHEKSSLRENAYSSPDHSLMSSISCSTISLDIPYSAFFFVKLVPSKGPVTSSVVTSSIQKFTFFSSGI